MVNFVPIWAMGGEILIAFPGYYAAETAATGYVPVTAEEILRWAGGQAPKWVQCLAAWPWNTAERRDPSDCVLVRAQELAEETLRVLGLSKSASVEEVRAALARAPRTPVEGENFEAFDVYKAAVAAGRKS